MTALAMRSPYPSKVRIYSLVSRILVIFKVSCFSKMVWSNTLARITAMHQFFFGPLTISQKPCHSMSFTDWMHLEGTVSPASNCANPKPAPISFVNFRPESGVNVGLLHTHILSL